MVCTPTPLNQKMFANSAKAPTTAAKTTSKFTAAPPRPQKAIKVKKLHTFKSRLESSFTLIIILIIIIIIIIIIINFF
jgi:hypothetical protein